MKMSLMFALLLFVGACNGGKKAKETVNKQEEPQPKESPIPVEKNNGIGDGALPLAIQVMVDQTLREPVGNPPRKITSYTYKGANVFLVSAYCCDQFDKLFDEDGKLLCQPFGGFTGKGDGKCPDFASESSNEKLVWEDSRKTGDNGLD